MAILRHRRAGDDYQHGDQTPGEVATQSIRVHPTPGRDVGLVVVAETRGTCRKRRLSLISWLARRCSALARATAREARAFSSTAWRRRAVPSREDVGFARAFTNIRSTC
jgi:hypothetical protein